MFIYTILLYLVSVISFFSHVHIVDCKATYAITAPKIVRPGNKYQVIVSLHDIPERPSTKVFCTLTRENIKLNKSISKDDIRSEKTFESNELTQLFEKDVDKDWTEGVYKLIVNGTGGLNFSQVIDINVVYKHIVILIQSDKAIYKPGDNVLFRILLLENDLMPVEKADISDLKIYIIDPLGNKLRNFTLDKLSKEVNKLAPYEFKYSKGVTSELAFSLQNEAMLGKWGIQATTRGQVQNYFFSVNYYQLPLANVTITVPEFVTYNNTIIEYKVDCFYTFGKPVNGLVKVLITKTSECGNLIEPIPYPAQNISIHGSISGKIDLRNISLLNQNCSETRFNVTAIVMDNITKSIYINFEVFDVYQHDIKAQLISKQKKFKPGTTIRQHYKVLTIAGKVINEDIFKKIDCKATFITNSVNDLKTIEPISIIREESDIICDFKTEHTTIEIKSKMIYEDKSLLESSYKPFDGCKDVSVQVMLENPLQQLKVGEMVNLVITSNEKIKQLIYYIVVRGSIILHNTVNYNPFNETQKLPIQLTPNMVPEAIVAVFFTSSISGAIVSDSIKLRSKGIFHKEVSFNVTTPLVDASKKATIFINAEKTSNIFILGVDESVLAIKQGNDISEKRVLEELLYTFDVGDTASGFAQSGMKLISNADEECSSYYETDLITDPDVIPDPDENKDDKTIVIRKNFRETWLWARVQIPNNKNRVGISVKVPDSITSWRLTAFSIHDDYGLGLTRVPGHVTVFRPFFIKFNVPFSLKKGETSELHVLAFNYLDVEAVVEIEIMNNNTKNVEYLSFDGCIFNQKMKPNEIRTFTCYVTVHHVGEFYLLANAKAMSNSGEVKDGEVRPLLVVHEGLVKHKSKAVLFDLTNDDSKEITESIEIEFPAEAMLGTGRVFAFAKPDTIIISWKKELDRVINEKSITADFTVPDECCQQRLSYYYPKVYWLDYLKKTKKATEADIDLARIAIQKTIDLLCYQKPYDGSFVNWQYRSGDIMGVNNVQENKEKSSVWLTAYTLKLMYHSKDYVNVGSKSIDDAETWLLKIQKEDGTFLETDIEHQIMYTTPLSAYLTSYVYIALNSGDNLKPNERAEGYLANIFSSLTHPLDIVITCYALHIAKHQFRDTCYNEVLKMNELKINNQPDLQIAAYALMIFNMRGLNSNSLYLFKYILSKQKPNGWFGDNSLLTVICTEAITQYLISSNEIKTKDENILMNFDYRDKKESVHIKAKDELLQSFELSADTKEVKITASGYGKAVATIYWQYYVNESTDGSFIAHGEKLQKRGDEYILLKICTKYKSEETVKNVIMEIDLPSGYTFDRNGMKLVDPKLIDHIESTNSDTHLNIYLREVATTNVCVDIPAIQSFKVRDIRPAQLQVYSYYGQDQPTITQLTE